MYTILPERPQHAAAIETLLDQAFGPERQRKTVYRLRQGMPPLSELCFVLNAGTELAAGLRFWPVTIAGQVPALLLGSLATAPGLRGRGYGAALMRHGLAEAARLGHRAVLLVGDPAYYGRFGFSRGPAAALSLPGPVEAHRFLGLELVPGALAGLSGPLGPGRRLRAA